jgi:hypothetical protein
LAGWTAAAAAAAPAASTVTPAAWFSGELNWWGLKSSLHLKVAHTHYGSHYSFTSFIKSNHKLGSL